MSIGENSGAWLGKGPAKGGPWFSSFPNDTSITVVSLFCSCKRKVREKGFVENSRYLGPLLNKGSE